MCFSLSLCVSVFRPRFSVQHCKNWLHKLPSMTDVNPLNIIWFVCYVWDCALYTHTDDSQAHGIVINCVTLCFVCGTFVIMTFRFRLSRFNKIIHNSANVYHCFSSLPLDPKRFYYVKIYTNSFPIHRNCFFCVVFPLFLLLFLLHMLWGKNDFQQKRERNEVSLCWLPFFFIEYVGNLVQFFFCYLTTFCF